MAPETRNTWSPSVVTPAVSEAIASLAAELHAFNGHRTVWLDDAGSLWHAEPDEMLEELGHRYVGTFFRPCAEDVCEAVARALPVAVARPQARPAMELMPTPAFA